MGDTAAMGDEVDLEDLLSVLSPQEVAALVDEMAADPDDKHMPASVRTAYRCEKEPTGDLNRDSLINCINEIALNTPDKEEKLKYEAGVKRGKVYVPVYNEEEMADMEKQDAGQVKLDPDEEEALSNASVNDIMALADILNTNPQDFVMEAYADPLQYFEPDPPNDKNTKDVCLNNIPLSEQMACDIFNTLRNNENVVKLAATNCNLSDFAIQTLNAAIEENNTVKSLSLENNRISPDVLADIFEAAASPNNGLLEIRVAAQQQESMGQRVEERIANAMSKNPRLMKCGITLEFKEVILRVSKYMINNMDKLRQNRLKDGVTPGAGVKWTAARTLE